MPDWKNIDTVLLDMDGTLLDLHFDSYFWRQHLPQRYAFSRGLDVVTARNILTPWLKRHEGTLNWYCLDFWDRELGLDTDMLKREVAHLISVKEGALEFLDQLKKQGKQAVLVTNAHPRSLALKLEHTRLDNHLERIISAHELGLPKEEPIFWTHLQELCPYLPHRTLLVDDNLSVLRSARAFGMGHLLAACNPDSSRAARPTTEFPAFFEFEELLAQLISSS